MKETGAIIKQLRLLTVIARKEANERSRELINSSKVSARSVCEAHHVVIARQGSEQGIHQCYML